jgi:hypothetical protein
MACGTQRRRRVSLPLVAVFMILGSVASFALGQEVGRNPALVAAYASAPRAAANALPLLTLHATGGLGRVIGTPLAHPPRGKSGSGAHVLADTHKKPVASPICQTTPTSQVDPSDQTGPGASSGQPAQPLAVSGTSSQLSSGPTAPCPPQLPLPSGLPSDPPSSTLASPPTAPGSTGLIGSDGGAASSAAPSNASTTPTLGLPATGSSSSGTLTSSSPAGGPATLSSGPAGSGQSTQQAPTD